MKPKNKVLNMVIQFTGMNICNEIELHFSGKTNVQLSRKRFTGGTLTCLGLTLFSDLYFTLLLQSKMRGTGICLLVFASFPQSNVYICPCFVRKHHSIFKLMDMG